MPVGTKVCAMRDGVVVSVKQDSNEGGPNALKEKANLIWVLHEDGSVSKYVHLRENGVEVKIGQKVKASDLIGLSGFTGLANKPHLHVQVDVLKGFSPTDLISINFKGPKGKAFKVEEGKNYSSD